MKMIENIHYLELSIKKEDENREIKSILYDDLRLSTRKIRMLKREPIGILLDGQRASVRQIVKAGQILRIMLNDSGTQSKGGQEDRKTAGKNTKHIIPVKMDLDILYEDENLIFINKPAGIVCHPSKGHLMDSLSSGVQEYFDRTGQNSRIHLFGRLDKDTSGIVGIAKNKVTAERMNVLRQEKHFVKEYLALVEGCPDEKCGCIDIPMEESRNNFMGSAENAEYTENMKNAEYTGYLKMTRGTGATAKKAVTHYEVIQSFHKAALCRITIETGRTHQIRFHMASIGHPLLGDRLYGHFYEKKQSAKEKTIKRTALHAFQVQFFHPFTAQNIVLSAPLPEDMSENFSLPDKTVCTHFFL